MVGLVNIKRERRRIIQQPGFLRQADHRLVKGIQELEPEGRIVHQGPLAAAVFVRPVVAFARKINPFQIGRASCRERVLRLV